MATLVIARVALYARVSTLNGQNPQLQLAELREYAQRRGWEVSAEYVDLGISGAKDSRPQLNRMVEDAHARKFDAILVWKLDRFARSLKMLVTSIEDLNAYGVAFVSLRDNVDLSTPTGRLMLHIIGAMAEFERGLIQERVIAGIASAKSRGVRFGRPKVYVSSLKIKRLRDAGLPWVEVAKRLNAGKGTCQRALARAQKEEDAA
jgi:DNA invertase Pin-like site-specific DNA recombinase